jgi:hypothetical protein
MREAKIHSTAQAVDGGEEAREAASMRWKSIEAFNTAPDLSPIARRLGIALICSMDSKSRACFPSEIRLAALLDVHPSAIKKAKTELKKAGLIDWYNPGGPRHLSHYGFNSTRLGQYSADAKERADRAVTLRAYEPKNKRTKSSKDTDMNTLKPSIGTHVGTNGINATNAQSTQNSCQGTRAARQSTHTNPAKVPTPAPELSHYPPTTTAQHHHAASPAKAAMCEVRDKSSLSAGAVKSREAAPPTALEVKQRKPPCHFPALETAFSNEPDILATLCHQSFDSLRAAAVALAKGGPGKAREVLKARSAP